MKEALKEMVKQKGELWTEKVCELYNLQQAQEIWLLNATRGIQAIEQFQGISYSYEIAKETARELNKFLSK
jgi:branched-subunit amino acid aminotransferase/4-amino-4-deoxychorismate lyase